LPRTAPQAQKAIMKAAPSKTLVLHIGANKTGSSAIQEFLGLNCEALARRGVMVAPSDLMRGGTVTGQHVPFIEHLRFDMAFGRKIVAERIALLMRDLPERGTLVVSAENLSNLNGTHELFADTIPKHNVQVILYIRRQDELLLSSWQQWGSKTTGDFWAWAVGAAGQRGNWRLTLEPWEAMAAREHIVVRIYDRAKMFKQNVVADFLQTIGRGSELQEFQMPAVPANRSYSDAVVDFVKGNPLLFRDMHDNAVYGIIETLTGDRFVRNPRESVITHEERMALLQKYAAANAWVQNRYFANSNGSLFVEPRPEDYDVLSPGMLKVQKWDLVASLIHGLAQRVPAG
jgi:hypothetical protein